MAHNFDLVFGYSRLLILIPQHSLPPTGPLCYSWGNYIRERGFYIKVLDDIIWKAFRTGRAAIVAKNYKAVNEQGSNSERDREKWQLPQHGLI